MPKYEMQENKLIHQNCTTAVTSHQLPSRGGHCVTFWEIQSNQCV